MAQNIFESQFLPFPVWLPPHPFRFFRELFPNKLTQIPLFTFGFWKTDEKLTVSMELGAWRPGMLKVLQCHKNLTQQRMSLPKRPKGFPGGASGKEPACQFQRHKRHGFHPWVRKIPQYSCLENPRDRGACWATVRRVAKSQSQLTWLST